MSWQHKIKKCLYNPEFPEISQVIVSFTLGFCLAAWSKPLFITVGVLILYELAFVWACDEKHWRFENRLLVVLVYIYGYMLGRLFIGKKIEF